MKTTAKRTRLIMLVAAVLTIGGLTACGDEEPQTNMPQAPDMALEGELDYDPLADAAAQNMDAEEHFEFYEDQHLSSLRLVSRDGTIKNGANFDTDYRKVPDFKAIKHIPERKEAFFAYLKPAISYQNQIIRERRKILRGIQIKLSGDIDLSDAQETYMATMRERYRIPEETTRPEAIALLLRRVDAIPESMVLAQAAMESAWGTSRFAREANNLFGQWCFTKGCGLVPKKRNKGASHEVAKFASIDKAVGAYFLNINSHPTYVVTRDVREKARAAGKPLSGHDMVSGLEKYSARGKDYIKELRQMMRTNKLG